ncbi:MAG: (2Fe-2S)-binding protein [Phycisphaerales bacterium]|nr:(2Fe-2S)-binding protein [Phycisphaerales bacterium]
MPKITVDGKQIECRDGVPVLQAVLEAGWDVPHYCYHPGLSVVASCRLCLMEMKMPHPQTKEMDWAPKLFPSCQTPVKDGMEVRFASEGVASSQSHVMEYYLVNHPLDCPVCDKAGECYLQDYSEKFGHASSRMVEDKHKNPKKDIGSKTLLYSDRCVVCSRCVRFGDEVAGAGELRVINRGHRAEIDVFPGVPLENELQGNVVDLCPVGALLSKDFLFQQRVWNLRSTPSVDPTTSAGATIWIDHNDDRIFRVRPRFNEKVNEWWISDETRFGWKYVADSKRLNQPLQRDNGAMKPLRWEAAPELLRRLLDEAASADQGVGVACVLSPMLSCEEAWLLSTFVRSRAPQATLVTGYVPVSGPDKTFPKGFKISAEKAPNRRGVESIIKAMGGPNATFEQFVKSAGDGKFKLAYVTGGYPQVWLTADQARAIGKVQTLITHDLFESALDEYATIRLPGASWAEREGSFMNADGLIQPFERALKPLDGVKSDGQFFHELVGRPGLYRGAKTREAMAEKIPAFGDIFVPRPEPEHAH